MQKNLFRSISFFLVFGLLFFGVSHLLVPKDNTDTAGIHDAWAKGFLAEPENTIDVLFLGDSELYSCVVPLTIWEAHGITSYSCGTSDQKLYQTESFLQRVFQTQSPKVVFLETNILYRDYSITNIIPHAFEELFPLIRYHDRWKELTLADLTHRVQFTDTPRDKGYLYLTDIEPADASSYMVPTEEEEAISSKNIRHLKSILAFCQEKGVRLVLFSSPSTANWDYLRHNRVARLSEELGIEYIDMNLLTQEIPIDWQLDTRDGGDHMNHTGAVKVTEYLGNYLAALNLFENKTENPDYDSWNQDLASFQKEAG